jgi:hypothetical protein
MGDMIKCGRCSTHHYRNDPCVEMDVEPMCYCPQCLEDSTADELRRNEGYCRLCCRQNRQELDQHNAEFDRWDRMSDAQREADKAGLPAS